MTGFDINGDVHGCADKLVGLLTALGYGERHGAWRHRGAHAVFVGDLIDRGPKQEEVVTTVRSMVDAGAASVIMGNHEFNAISWAMPDPTEPGNFMRSHHGSKGEKIQRQHGGSLHGRVRTRRSIGSASSGSGRCPCGSTASRVAAEAPIQLTHLRTRRGDARRRQGDRAASLDDGTSHCLTALRRTITEDDRPGFCS